MWPNTMFLRIIFSLTNNLKSQNDTSPLKGIRQSDSEYLHAFCKLDFLFVAREMWAIFSTRRLCLVFLLLICHDTHLLRLMCTTLLYMLFGLAAIIVLAADISLHFPRPGNSQIKWVFQNRFKLYLKFGILLWTTILRPYQYGYL